MNIPRDKITSSESEKIHILATQIVFAIINCGPTAISNVDGKTTESSRIHGFQSKKARDIIKDRIEDFILKGF